jgi:hypothetical protein
MVPFQYLQGESTMIILASNIIKSFNSIIADYLKDGYMISPFSMKGSFSDAESFVDLVRCDKADHIIRVWMSENCMAKVGTSYHYIRIKSISVKRYDFECETNINDITWPHTLWFNGGVLIKEVQYYAFANRSDKSIYTDSLDEAIAYFNIQSSRYSNRRAIFNNQAYVRDVTADKLPSKFVSHIMDRIHKVRGFKHAAQDCISKVTIIRDNERFKSIVQYSFNGKTGFINLH